MECRMSLEVYFLRSLLDFYPEKFGEVSDKQVEGFNQGKSTEYSCLGLWKDSMLADIVP
jgi:hypothetical protein